MDQIDSKIIQILKSNARIHNVEIAHAVGLTEGAVRHRISNLTEDGTIARFTIETAAGGATYFGVVMVKAKHETKTMMKAIAALALHKDAYEIAGEYDGCLILDGGSIEEIDAKIDRVRKLDEVTDTRTFLSFRKW